MDSVVDFEFTNNEEILSLSYFYSNLPSFMSSLNVNQSSTGGVAAGLTTLPIGTDADSVGSQQSESAEAKPSEITFSKRFVPSRSAKNKQNATNLLKLKRRSIIKPRKVTQEINLSPAAIKNLYLKNKVPNSFKPSNLETIFEEECEDNASVHNLIGMRKLKRSLSCSDGLNHTKALLKSRRQKIKKKFGRRFALKKIPLTDFIVRLNSSFEDDENDTICGLTTPSTSSTVVETDTSSPRC